MRNIIYIKRLWNAIRGKEYREAYYQYNLNGFILELIVSFIDSNRCWYNANYTEDSWEKKLKTVKQSILDFHKIDEAWWSTEGGETVEESVKKYNEAHKKMLENIVDIFPDLWD